MISHIHQTKSFPRHVHFLYSTRRPDSGSTVEDVLFLPRLRGIATSPEAAGRMRLGLFLTGEKDDSTNVESDTRSSVDIRKGRITSDDLVASLGDPGKREGTVCYICGPAGMTDEFVELVKNLPDMRETKVFCEKWW